MSTITFKGNPINTIGNLPEVGKDAQEFTMVSGDLSEKNLADYTGKRVVLNIFPSIDTGIQAVKKPQTTSQNMINGTLLKTNKRF